MPRKKKPESFTIGRENLVRRLALYRLDEDQRALAVIEDLFLWFSPGFRLGELDADVEAAMAELTAFRRSERRLD